MSTDTASAGTTTTTTSTLIQCGAQQQRNSPMHDGVIVAVLHRRDDLLEQPLSLFRRRPPLRHDVVEKLSVRCILLKQWNRRKTNRNTHATRNTEGLGGRRSRYRVLYLNATIIPCTTLLIVVQLEHYFHSRGKVEGSNPCETKN